MSELRDQHKAFAEWFLQQNPIAPNVEDMAWAAWKAALAQPETKAEPVAWMYTFHGVNRLVFANDVGPYIVWHGTPLYAHPPRDEWRPASVDCRTCRHLAKLDCMSTAMCIDGSQYKPTNPVQMWEKTP